jgi:hypothetical protein
MALHYIVLHCIVLHESHTNQTLHTWHYITLKYNLYITVQYHTSQYIALPTYIDSHGIQKYCHCITLNYITLRPLHYITLNYITLHYIIH